MNSIVDPKDFPGSQKYTYLNTANVALMYAGAEKAILEWQQDVALNGSFNFDETAEEAVSDGLHEPAARLFKAKPEDIAAGSSSTELLSTLAWAIMPGAGSNVVSSEVIFPTTVYPFQRVTHHTGGEIRLASGRDGGADTDDIIQLIDSKTSVVAVSHVEYRTGQCFDLPALAEAAHSHGALLVVDATQSAGAIPIDAPGEDIDALVSGGYKWLCGPFGAAVMYVGPRLRALEPGLVGWRSHKEMWDLQASRLTYPDGARRFEYSTVAYGCVLGLAQAIDFLVRVDVETIFAHNKKLTNLLIEGLQSRDIKITSPISDSSPPIITARFPGGDSEAIARKLKQAKVYVSARADIIRFSPHLYNSSADIERALAHIDALE